MKLLRPFFLFPIFAGLTVFAAEKEPVDNPASVPALSGYTWTSGDPVPAFEPGKLYMVETWHEPDTTSADRFFDLNRFQKKYADKGLVTIVLIASKAKESEATKNLLSEAARYPSLHTAWVLDSGKRTQIQNPFSHDAGETHFFRDGKEIPLSPELCQPVYWIRSNVIEPLLSGKQPLSGVVAHEQLSKVRSALYRTHDTRERIKIRAQMTEDNFMEMETSLGSKGVAERIRHKTACRMDDLNDLLQGGFFDEVAPLLRQLGEETRGEFSWQLKLAGMAAYYAKEKKDRDMALLASELLKRAEATEVSPGIRKRLADALALTAKENSSPAPTH